MESRHRLHFCRVIHHMARRWHPTGNPNRPLEEHTRDELYNMAKEKKVEGRSKMTRDELIRAVGR